jgi:UDP-N-acetylmuramate--alanine ligase
VSENDSGSHFRTPNPDAILTPLDLIGLARQKPVHFMGIGGAGMSPLAELVQRAGGMVTGCDAHLGASARSLRDAGISVEGGHDPAHVDGCAALVLTAAVPSHHPEVQAARDAGIPVLKRAQALGALVNRAQVVGIAGTHGKTTTTALATSALSAAGLDPTGLVGARVPAWGGNLRLGGDRLYVVEADEFDRSFLTLRPSIAVVTTLEADHLDIFGDLAGVEEAFTSFLDLVPEGGLIVGCGDDAGVGRLFPRVAPGRRLVSYGLNAGNVLRAEDVRAEGVGSRFSVREKGRLLGEVRVGIPGLHNVRNALAAIAVARELGAGWSEIVEGLAGFGGTSRRFERVGEAAGVVVVDDYAHHPTEVNATLQAAHASFPERRIVAVFQPHLFSRTRDFAGDFGRELARADLAVVADVYPAREEPIPGVTGELVADGVRAAGGEVVYLPERSEVTARVADLLREGDLCLTLGAGDLDEAAREILGLLEQRSAGR